MKKKVSLKDLRPNRTAPRRPHKSPKAEYGWTVAGMSIAGTVVGLIVSTVWEMAECQYWGIQDVAMADPAKWRIVAACTITSYFIIPMLWMAYHAVQYAILWPAHQILRCLTCILDWFYGEYLNPVGELAEVLRVRHPPAGSIEAYKRAARNLRVAFLEQLPSLILSSRAWWFAAQLALFGVLLPTCLELTQALSRRGQAHRDTFFVFEEDGTSFVVLRVADGKAHARSLIDEPKKLGSRLVVRKLETLHAAQRTLGRFPPYHAEQSARTLAR